MKYKMIASDLDGTLNNNKYIISEGNAKAIKKAMDAGLKVVLCSGRSPVSLANYAEKIGLDKKGCYGIGFNGATVYESDTKKVIFEAQINKDLAKVIIKNIKEVSPDVNIMAFVTDKHLISEKYVDVLESYNEGETFKFDVVGNMENIGKDIIKVMLIDKREVLNDIYSKMENLINNKYNMVFTGENILEFMPLAINKAEGIAKLAKHLGISLEEIVGVGDNYNDIEMIQEVGLGIAVANAVEPLKAVADYITIADNDNDAMVEVVDLILKP